MSGAINGTKIKPCSFCGGQPMTKYITGVITGIGIALLAAVLLPPRMEDLQETWDDMLN